MQDEKNQGSQGDTGVPLNAPQDRLGEPASFDQAIRERDAWYETAADFARNMEYYRNLVDECAKHLGPEVFICDDGSVSESPLRAKVPELVAALASRAEQAS